MKLCGTSWLAIIVEKKDILPAIVRLKEVVIMVKEQMVAKSTKD